MSATNDQSTFLFKYLTEVFKHPYLVSARLQNEAIDLKHAIELWVHKESDFKFLESKIIPQEAELARELVSIFSEAELLFYEQQKIKEARIQDDLDPLPQHFFEVTQSLDELDWVETLYEEELLEEDHPILLQITMDCARKVMWALIEDVCSTTQLKLHPQAYLSPVENLEPDLKWVGEQRLQPLPLHRLKAWGALGSTSAIKQTLNESFERLKKQFQKIEQAWSKDCEERDLMYDLSFWHTHILPCGQRWATRYLTSRLVYAISEDVADRFELLAKSERPRDHRVGALIFSGARHEEVTVIFAKRDGQILAQREVSWDPEHPELICNAFDSIKIRTLVAPDLVPEQVERALEHLCERYRIARISQLGHIEIKRPHNLSVQAQIGLQLAQRYVAPLRYWARANLLAIAQASLDPSLYELISHHESWQTIYLRSLKGRVNSEWVRLRSLRQQPDLMNKPLLKNLPAPPEQPIHTHPLNQNILRRGDLVDVTLTEITPYRLKGEITSKLNYGRQALISLSGSRDLKESQQFKVGQSLQAFVIHDHPKQEHAQLTLRALSSSAKYQNRSYPSKKQAQGQPQNDPLSHSKQQIQQNPSKSDSSAERDTLNTLNSMFKKKR